MVKIERMESGDSSCLKVRDHKTKSSRSKRDRSLLKQERGDELVYGKTKKSYRSVHKDRHNEKDKPTVKISLLLVGNKENRNKSVKGNRNLENTSDEEVRNIFENSVSFNHEEKSSSQAPKTEMDPIHKIDSILKNSNPRSELIKEGVRFDKSVMSGDKEKIRGKEKSKIVDKSEKKSKDKHQSSGHKSSEKKKQKNFDEKSCSHLTSERHKDINKNTEKAKSELKENSEHFNYRLKSKTVIKNKTDSTHFNRFVDKNSEESESKKEYRHERRDKKKNRELGSIADSVSVICPEKKKSRKKGPSIEEVSNVAIEFNKTAGLKTQVDTKSKHRREKKDDYKENDFKGIEKKEKVQKRKKHNPYESGESDGFFYQTKNGLKECFKDELEYLNNSLKLERHRNESFQSEASESRIERDKLEKNEIGETNPNKRKAKKTKHRTFDNEPKQDFDQDKLTPDKPLNCIKTENEENLECTKNNDNSKFIDTSSGKEFPFKKKLKELSKIEPINIKEETTQSNSKHDKYIKLSNKEEILMKGMQDLTVKELYLMENLKDYELKLNEQCLKKIKKKKREPQNMSENIDGQPLIEKSNMPAVTNLPVCKLPSVKEIFKISNLADYEKSYKEMQDKKKKRYCDMNKDEFNISTSLGRKKLNKFSLESKEENSNINKKIIPSKSSQWLLNNMRRASLKNEGGGEHMICNVSLIYVNENGKNSDKEKNHETGDASGPCNLREMHQDFRAASKTALKDKSNYSNGLEKNVNYIKMCQKFHKDIRDESKKLLQNLAGNKNVRISIKDSSVQSIKKKPSLSSKEGLSPINNHKFDYVLLKKPKRDLGDNSLILKQFRTEMKEGVIREPTESENIEFPWKLAKTNDMKDYYNTSSNGRAFDKNFNKNTGVFIKNEYKSDSTSPDNLFNLKYKSDPISSDGNFTQSSVDYNLSNSSYSLSMFDRIKDLSIPNNISLRNPGDLDLLKRCDVSRESPEINVLRNREKPKSRIDDSRGAWFQRSSTLERIINEIEDFPEKDTDPSCNVISERKFDDKANKPFSEIDKSSNVLLSYISHGNYNVQKRNKNRNDAREEKKSRLLNQFSDRLTRDKNLMPNGRQYRDSLCSLKHLKSLEQNRLSTFLLSGDRDVERSCIVCSRSCANIASLNNERNKKPRTNVLKASLQSASTTFKCDLKAEERENVINTKLVISDPSKRNNILQIQFCGKLNINFNKDNIELGNGDSFQKPMEINYTEAQNDCNQKFKSRRINPEDILSLSTRDFLSNHRYSEDCLNKNRSLTSTAQSENSLSNYDSKSDSSKTIVYKGKRSSSLSQDNKIKNIEAHKGNDSLIDLAIPTEINSSKNREKINLEENFYPDIVGSMVDDDHENCFQIISSEKTSKTNEKHLNLAMDNLLNNVTLTDGKDIPLSEARIEVLKERSNQIDLGVIENNNKPAVEHLNLAHFKSVMELHKEESSDVIKTIDKNYLFLNNENSDSVALEKKTKSKITPSNLDASVQTVNAHCETVFNTQNVLCCDVETCTPSSFELSESDKSSKGISLKGSVYSAIKKEDKSYSSSINASSEDTSRTGSVNTRKDVTTSSSEGVATSNKEANTDSLLIKFSQEKIKENVRNEISLPSNSQEIPLPEGDKGTDSTNLSIPKKGKSGFIEANESGIFSESSHNVDGKKDPVILFCHPKQNSHPDHSTNEVDQETRDNAQNDNNKLLLSQSEEDAFKYLLLKSIGKADTDNKLSTKSVHEFSDCFANSKVMFSAIKKRLEYFKSKAGDSKVDVKRATNTKQREFSAIERRNKNVSLERECPNCSVCSCGKPNPFAGYWDIQRSRNNAEHSRGQTLQTETQILAPEVLKPISQNQNGEKPVINNSTVPTINDCHSTSQCDLGDMSEEMLYELQNFSGNPFLKQYPPIKKGNESFVSSQISFPDHLGQKHFSEKVRTKNVRSPQRLRKFYKSDQKQCDKINQFIDDVPWSEYGPCVHLGELCSHYCNKLTLAGGLPSCCLPQKHFSSNPIQNNSANFRQSERLSFSNHECQAFPNDTCHKKPNKQQCKTTNLLPSGTLRDSNNLIDNLFYNMENSSNHQGISAPVENTHTIDNAEEDTNKKLTRKHKFSKHASKIWKSLFKKTKKYGTEILEYEDIPPEHFIEQRPKITENKLKIKKWLKKISQSKANDFQTVQEKLFKKLNKIMTSEVTMPLQEVFDIIQKPQFHRDNHSYSGRKKFDRVHTCNYLSNDGHYIMITEKLNVRGFLVSIGLKDDVAWEAHDNAELNTRLHTAITEARSWVNKITMSQGLLIYILAVMTPTEVDNYYLQIVEAIINSRISNVGTLLSVMMVLKRYERGKYGIKTVISKEHVRDLVPKQVSETEKRHQDNRSRFIYLYNIAKRAAGKVNMKVDKDSAGLLARLTASYSPGLKPYFSLLAHYIAQKIIYEKGQLTMAVSYLQSLHIKHFDKEIFEQSCGLDQNKVVLKSETLESLSIHNSQKRQGIKHRDKHPGRSNTTEPMQASWVKRKKNKPLKESSEKIVTDKSTLERKPSTMDLLKEHKKTDT